MGRPVDAEAEDQILSQLLVRVCVDEAGNQLPDGQVRTLANAFFSRNVLLAAAKHVQAHLPAASPMKHLTFSDGWASGFLGRQGLCRKRVSTEIKGNVPDIAIVRQADADITAYLDANGIDADGTINLDETNCSPSVGLKYGYVPKGDSRAAGPPETGNSFTIEVAVTASGNMLPWFFVMKNTVQTPDSTSSTVIANLATDPLFSPARGWVQKVWEAEIDMTDKKTGKMKKVLFKRHYLEHAVAHHIITAQHKAWMCTGGMIMYAQLVLEPYQTRLGKRVLIIADNCALHKASAVADYFARASVPPARKMNMMFMAPNVTPWKQPLDIAVNGSLKARLRQLRISETFKDFMEFKTELAGNPRAIFKPKAIPLPKALDWLFQVHMSYQDDKNFKQGMTRVFVKVGYLKTLAGQYNLWAGPGVTHLCDSNSAAFKASIPADALGNVGELLAGMDLDLARRDEEPDDDEADV